MPQPPFEVPEFTQDNITRILNNLVFRILKKCYSEGFKQMEEIPLIGDTSLEGLHDSNNCEACLQGFCAHGGLGLASSSSVPLLSLTPSKLVGEPTVPSVCINIPCSQPPSKVEKPQALIVNPKVSNPTKADPKFNHAPKSSTVPTLATQPAPPVISPAPRFVHQMPYPSRSSRAAGVATQNTRPKRQRAPPVSSSSVTPTSSLVVSTSSSFVPPTTSFAAPPSWRPPANTTCRVEHHTETYVSSESSPICESCLSCFLQGLCSCHGFLLVIFVIIVVLLAVKNII